MHQIPQTLQTPSQHLILMKDSDTVVVEEKPYPLVCPVTMELQSTIKILIEMWHVACTIMLQLLPTAATGKTKASFIDFIACLTELYMLLYQCKCHYAYTHFCICLLLWGMEGGKETAAAPAGAQQNYSTSSLLSAFKPSEILLFIHLHDCFPLPHT